MQRAVQHLTTHHSGGLPLKPGGRKTSITLTAFEQLRAVGTVQSMLVIAPLRVCRQVWRQEGAKWSHLRHLKFALLHGPKKDEVLRTADADVYLINPEGVAWLCKKFYGRQLPFDVMAIDELTRFKNHQSERSKALRPRIDKVKWKWGLTGSLAPNGFMDLFGQQLMLDGGAALGRYITHYRDQYFQVDYNGFDYNLIPGADKRIVEKLAPYWMAVDESDYSQLPPFYDNVIALEFDKATRATYDKMKKDLLAELPEGIVTAANQAACYSKLSQMANGATYLEKFGARATAHLHDLKLDAVDELLEELSGEPLLLAYEFNSDFERLRERFGKPLVKDGPKVLPYLGAGTTPKQENEWIAAWNRGELPLLCAHPASAGHGLNLQEGSAANVAWFGITWDFELYDQFIRRVWRSGNQAKQVFNHLLIVRGTIDELKLEALRDKDMTQMRLLRALNTQVLREAAETLGASGIAFDDRRLPMVQRLSRQNPVAEQQVAHNETQPVRPKGWGASAGQAAADSQPTQRERIAQQIAPQDAARSAFSGAVGEQTDAIRSGDYGEVQGQQEAVQVKPAPQAEPAKRTRTRSAAKAEPEVQAAQQPDYEMAKIRLAALKLALSDPETSLEEGCELAGEMVEWAFSGDLPPAK